VIISLKTSIPRHRDEYNFFPTLVEQNLTFFLYYREAHTNIDICHGIDAIVSQFEIKTRMLLDSAGTTHYAYEHEFKYKELRNI
jgi:hypothetical protein